MDFSTYILQTTGASWDNDDSDTQTQQQTDDEEIETDPQAGTNWLTVDEVDEVLDLPRPIVKSMADPSDDRLESIEKNGKFLVSSESVEEYRQNNLGS